jgi:hypothetical protein
MGGVSRNALQNKSYMDGATPANSELAAVGTGNVVAEPLEIPPKNGESLTNGEQCSCFKLVMLEA